MENLGILAHNRSGVKIKEIKGRAPGSIDAFLNKDGLCRLQSTTLFIQGLCSISREALSQHPI